jgi:hypothetical protein
MTKSAFTGPIIAYGDRNPLGTGSSGTVNADKAPSLIWGGVGMIDPRVGYNVTRWGAIGWGPGAGGSMPLIDQVPYTATTNNIAASQAVASGGSFTLVSSSGTGVTVVSTSNQATVWASGNTPPVGALALDGLPGIVTYGLTNLSNGYTVVSLYDPTKALTRCVTLTSNSGGDSGTVTISGADLYGYPQTQALTVNAGSTVTTTKAFKFIYSATLSSGGSLASGALLGTADTIGLPMLANTQGYVDIFWNSAWVTASTGFTGAVTTTPSGTTGDVRGTYALQASSNNTLRFQLFMSVAPANLGTITGLVGQTPA